MVDQPLNRRHYVALTILVSAFGYCLFWAVINFAGDLRAKDEATRHYDASVRNFESRIKLVEVTARRFGDKGTDRKNFYSTAETMRSDVSFVSLQWMPRVESHQRTAFEKEIRDFLQDPSARLRISDRDAAKGDRLWANETAYPLRFSSVAFEHSNAIGVWRKNNIVTKLAAKSPQDVFLSKRGIARAVVPPGESVETGVVVVRFKDLFGPVTDADSAPVLTDRQILRKTNSGDEVVGPKLRHRPGKMIVSRDFEFAGGELYSLQFTGKPAIARSRLWLAMLGLLLGPVFSCSLFRFRLQRTTRLLQSQNHALSYEVIEQQEIQRTTQALLQLREEERQLLSNEIHDGFVQEVMSAQMFLEALAIRIDESDATAKSHLGNAQQLIELAISEARQLINGLQPQPVDLYGFIPALQRLVNTQRELYQIEVSLRYSPDFPTIGRDYQNSIYRIAQEGLANVRKHSGAKTAIVTLFADNENVTVEVVDQGRGFEMDEVRDGSFGLSGIVERANVMGGTADVRSVPGDGTKLTVQFPRSGARKHSNGSGDRDTFRGSSPIEPMSE